MGDGRGERGKWRVEWRVTTDGGGETGVVGGVMGHRRRRLPILLILQLFVLT